MPNVRVTIDGKEVAVPANSTVLQAAEMAGLDIPTLCDHPAIEPVGSCRMCLVEIEKQRVLQPACTFPVFEGMVAHTRSEKVVEARQFILQLLFSERNHFCMFCQMSGSCELQDLAYEYELDHWQFDRPFPKYPVDASRVYFVMDHNRCILCRRCIRVCDDLVGNATLGLKNRGADTMIMADLDVPFGESSCIACGSCLQVCPTGALMDRASAYMGATEEIERVKTHCMACPIGCGIELIIRENRVIRVEGDWDASPNRGLICEVGRFYPLHEKRNRVRRPMVKRNGAWEAVEADEAYATVADRMNKAGQDVATIVSGFVTLEEGRQLLDAVPGDKYLMHPVPRLERDAEMTDLDDADLFIVVDTDLTADFQVAGFAVKRGVRHRGARLLLLGDCDEGMAEWAMRELSHAEQDVAITMARDAQLPVVIAGPQGIGRAEAFVVDVPGAKLLTFVPGGNSRGLAEAGYEQMFEGQDASIYYVVAGEIQRIDPGLLEQLRQAEYVVVKTSYREPWDEIADVILPMPTTFEKSGTTVNADGVQADIVAGVRTRLSSFAETTDTLAALIQ